jgi:hypothetical protein
MIRSNPVVRLSAAVAIGVAATILAAGVALAHPESEGAHPSGCVVTVEPGSVAVGGQFTVAGNFGGASIYLVKGADAAPAENAVADATTPAGNSFSVTFTAEAGDVGDWTVVASILETECGDSDALTVTAALPNAAMDQPSALVLIGWLALVVGLTAGLLRLASRRP